MKRPASSKRPALLLITTISTLLLNIILKLSLLIPTTIDFKQLPLYNDLECQSVVAVSLEWEKVKPIVFACSKCFAVLTLLQIVYPLTASWRCLVLLLSKRLLSIFLNLFDSSPQHALPCLKLACAFPQVAPILAVKDKLSAFLRELTLFFMGTNSLRLIILM